MKICNTCRRHYEKLHNFKTAFMFNRPDLRRTTIFPKCKIQINNIRQQIRLFNFNFSFWIFVCAWRKHEHANKNNFRSLTSVYLIFSKYFGNYLTKKDKAFVNFFHSLLFTMKQLGTAYL